MGPWITTPDMEQYSINGKFVQIQDGFRSKEMLGPIKGAPFPGVSLGNRLYMWLLITCEAKAVKPPSENSINQIWGIIVKTSNNICLLIVYYMQILYMKDTILRQKRVLEAINEFE